MILTMLKGLPASGKSYWAKEQVAASEGAIKRINKDDLRGMIDGGKWSKGREKAIIEARNVLANEFLAGGYSVIVDDTNFEPKHEDVLRRIAELNGADFEVKYFYQPVTVCEARDAARDNPVGNAVIRDMWRRYVCKDVRSIATMPDLPYAILVDIDGTLADTRHRNPYDQSKYLGDTLYGDVWDVILNHCGAKSGQHDVRVIVCSGRSAEFKDITENWLSINGVRHDDILMRAADDKRADWIVKRELYDNHIRDKYNVICVFDDRQQVVDMWREQGLRCFQVADGIF